MSRYWQCEECPDFFKNPCERSILEIKCEYGIYTERQERLESLLQEFISRPRPCMGEEGCFQHLGKCGNCEEFLDWADWILRGR